MDKLDSRVSIHFDIQNTMSLVSHTGSFISSQFMEGAHMTLTWLHLSLHLCWFNLQQHMHIYWYIATTASDLFWASVGSETYLSSYCSAVV